LSLRRAKSGLLGTTLANAVDRGSAEKKGIQAKKTKAAEGLKGV